MRCYWNLLDRVPPEACSVPLILHCMLEQVRARACSRGRAQNVTRLPLFRVQVAVSAEEPPPEPDGPPESCRLDDPLVRFLLRRFLPQARSEEEQRSMQRRLLPGLSAAEKIVGHVTRVPAQHWWFSGRILAATREARLRFPANAAASPPLTCL